MIDRKILISISIMILINILVVLSIIFRRKIALNSEYPINSIYYWINFLTNPSIIFVFLTLLIAFILNMITSLYLDANNTMIISWALSFPTFLLTIFLSKLILNETISSNRYYPIFIILIGTLVSIYGLYKYLSSI